MKKYLLFIVILLGIIIPVHAANYEMKELIPENTKTTIRGEHLLYKEFSYQGGIIKFTTIKNNSTDPLKATVSIGLFDSKKKNIGTINYCGEDKELSSKEEKDDVSIEIKSSYLGPKKSLKDVKYIALLGENTSCRTDGSTEFLGQTVEQIGVAKNNTLNSSEMMIVNIMKWVGIVIFVVFIYKFLFTGAYRNVDGQDVRQEYSYINNELKKERIEYAKKNPPQPKVVKINKSKEIIEQEKIQHEKDIRDDSDLHNMYR